MFFFGVREDSMYNNESSEKKYFCKGKICYSAESIALLRMPSQTEDFLKQNTTVEIPK